MSDAGRREPPQSPADVERQIDRTRVAIAQTVDAIERKLNPRYLMEKGMEMFRDSFNGSEALSRSLAVMRANPVPFALFGMGAAWLIASNTGVIDRVAEDQHVKAAGRRVSEFAGNIGDRAGAVASDMAGRVGIGGSSADQQPLGRTGNPVVDEAGAAGSGGWVHQVADMAQGALRSMRDSSGAIVNRAGNYAGGGATRIGDQLTDAVRRHPLVIGAIGVMAGALAGSVLPLTETEEEWLGGTREEIWTRAEDVGQQAVVRVREAASRAATRVVDAAAEAATAAVKEEIAHPFSQK
jgi:hypothetical protein